jgi:hypothetical protein
MKKKKFIREIHSFFCKICDIETEIITDQKIKIRDLCCKCFRKKYKNINYLEEEGKNK